MISGRAGDVIRSYTCWLVWSDCWLADRLTDLDALLEALRLKSTNEDGDLHEAPLRHRAHGGKSVKLAEVVGSVRREMVDVGENEAEPRELGNTAVLGVKRHGRGLSIM